MIGLLKLENIFSKDDMADFTSGEMAAYILVVFGASDKDGT
jgi:hypothetical protein